MTESDQIPEVTTAANMTLALILSLSVCYHARLQKKRREYELGVVEKFTEPLHCPKQFRNDIELSVLSVCIIRIDAKYH